MRRKEERSKQGQTNNKTKQHSTPKAVTFPKKNELFEYLRTLPSASGGTRTHDTLHYKESALPLNYQGSSASCMGLNHTSHSAPDEQAYY